MTSVAKIDPAHTPAAPPADESAALIAMIERASRDPNVDLDKMERLFKMHEAAQDRRAKHAYFAALSAMQPKLPVIGKKGVISKNEKDAKGQNTGRQEEMTKYAKWEDVVEAIRPTMAEYGFAVSFRISYPTPDRVLVTGILSHAEGHSEETAMSLPIDSSGAKNNVQGWGSSVSYGKRYTAFALLNIVARDEDDDGRAAAAPATITSDQEARLREMISSTNSDAEKFCRYLRVETLSQLPASRFDAAVGELNRKARKI